MLLGAQLYTLRDYIQNERDIRFTLAQVAKMGYTTIQVSGMGPIDPQVLRSICEENGLRVVLTHTDPARILNDTDAVIREHDILGCDYIGIGAMPEKYRSAFWLPHFTADFKEPARRIAAAGKKLMYHNHNFEFRSFGGKTGMEILFEETSPNFQFELDTFWVQKGASDVRAWIEKVRGRMDVVHFKDMALDDKSEQVMAEIGQGNLNWDGIIAACRDIGVKWYLVEQDDCRGRDPFESLKISYDFLTSKGVK